MLPIRSRTGFANRGSRHVRCHDQKLIGLPENPPALPVEIVLQVNGQELRYLVDTKYRTVDEVTGDVPRPVVISPPVFVNVVNSVFDSRRTRQNLFRCALPRPVVLLKENLNWLQRRDGKSLRRLSR